MAATVENLAGLNARDGGIAGYHFIPILDSAESVTMES